MIFPRVFWDVSALWTAHLPAYKLLQAEHPWIYIKRLLHYEFILSLFTVLRKETRLNFNYLLRIFLLQHPQEKFRKLKEEEESLKGEESAKRQKIEELLRIACALGFSRHGWAELQGSAWLSKFQSFDLFSAKLIQVGQVEESKKAQEELKNREKEARQQMRNLEKARQLLHMGSSLKLMESHEISLVSSGLLYEMNSHYTWNQTCRCSARASCKQMLRLVWRLASQEFLFFPPGAEKVGATGTFQPPPSCFCQGPKWEATQQFDWRFKGKRQRSSKSFGTCNT